MRAELLKVVEDITALRKRIQTLALEAQSAAEQYGVTSSAPDTTDEEKAAFHQQQHYEAVERTLVAAAAKAKETMETARSAIQHVDNALRVAAVPRGDG